MVAERVQGPPGSALVVAASPGNPYEQSHTARIWTKMSLRMREGQWKLWTNPHQHLEPISQRGRLP
jgi:hypothetical protein